MAHNRARKRCPRGDRKLVTNIKLRHYVLSRLRSQWSAQQISAGLSKDYPNDRAMQVCAETIYTYLYVLPRGELRRELLSHLR